MDHLEINGEKYVLVPIGAIESAKVRDLDDVSVPEVMSAKDFATRLHDGTKPVTVRRMCKDGALPATRIGREWYVRAREAFGLEGLVHEA